MPLPYGLFSQLRQEWLQKKITFRKKSVSGIHWAKGRQHPFLALHEAELCLEKMTKCDKDETHRLRLVIVRDGQEQPKDPRLMYKPKGPTVDAMCERCPFKPGGTGYAVDHEDFPDIVRHVQMGLPFYCHETAILSPQTKLRYDPELGEDVPDPPVQPHFKNCLGAVMVKRGQLEVPAPKAPKRRRKK